ncbi:hypothetical protein [Pelodictyon phaeoclathratiforme]|jgi:hypothetical protein|nr:hypothetical protein [Pelodictyon phaeoclathratiforme]MBV5290620.1 hypothetical protein [Pelodictyon phaeoclathratiforme]
MERAKKSEHDEASIFQQQIYFQFLKREAQGTYNVELQDTDQRETLLTLYGILDEIISSRTK